MPDLVTIYTATYPQDILVLRARLESENIECFVQDELTLQTNPFYSNAIGGVRLQVKQEDVEQAKAVLREGGYIPEGEDKKVVDSVFNRLFEKYFNKKQKIKMLLFLFGFLILSICVASYFYSKPDTENLLTNSEWCLDHIKYEGKNYAPNTLGFRATIVGECSEKIFFNEMGGISFPGFNTSSIYGTWKLNGDTLQIQKTDTLQNVLPGKYGVEVGRGGLILSSSKTIIYCN